MSMGAHPSQGYNALITFLSPALQDTMIMGADYYESDEQRSRILAAGQVPIGIGANTILRVSHTVCRTGHQGARRGGLLCLLSRRHFMAQVGLDGS